MATPYAPERRLLSIDVNDDEEVRGWLAQLLAEQVMTRREPVPAINLLKDDHEEVLDRTALRQADPEADLAATWAAVCARRDVERRILVLRLEHGDGNVEACMLEETWDDGAPTGWWFAHRRFGVVDGIGQLLGGGWQQHAGEGRAPEPFASMLTPAPGARPARLLPARAPEAQVWMQTDEVADGVRFPTTAMEMAEQTQSVVTGSLEREGFKQATTSYGEPAGGSAGPTAWPPRRRCSRRSMASPSASSASSARWAAGEPSGRSSCSRSSGSPTTRCPAAGWRASSGLCRRARGWIGVERRAGVDRRGDRHRAGCWTPK